PPGGRAALLRRPGFRRDRRAAGLFRAHRQARVGARARLPPQHAAAMSGTPARLAAYVGRERRPGRMAAAGSCPVIGDRDMKLETTLCCLVLGLALPSSAWAQQQQSDAIVGEKGVPMDGTQITATGQDLRALTAATRSGALTPGADRKSCA